MRDRLISSGDRSGAKVQQEDHFVDLAFDIDCFN